MEQLVTLGEWAKIGRGDLMDACRGAWTLLNQKKVKIARDIFRGLAVLDPENTAMHLGYAMACVADGDVTDAIDSLEKALLVLHVAKEDGPQVAEIEGLRATLLLKAGRVEDAVASGKAAVSQAAADAPWKEELAKAMEFHAQNVVKAEPVSPAITALIQGRMERVAQGDATLAWALGYSDQRLAEMVDAGTNLIKAGQFQRARRMFEGLVALDPTVPLFHLCVATACEMLEDAPGALQAFENALARAQGVPRGDDIVSNILLRRAKFLASLGNFQAAQQDARKVLTLPTLVVPDADRAASKALLKRLEALANVQSTAGGQSPKPTTPVGATPGAARAPPGKV